MKNSSKKKKLLAVAAALAIIAVLSGTFAWLTAQDQRINRAESAAVSGDDSVKVVEKWEPKPLVPGTEATKEVAVTNTGNTSVFVRVSYEEVLKHLADNGDITADATGKYNPINTDLDDDMPVNFDYTKAIADGFVEVPSGNVTGAATGEKLLVKGGKSVDPLTLVETYNYEAKMAYEYSSGKYQLMKAGQIVIDNENSSLEAKDWTFTVSNITYSYYAGGFKNTVVNWAESSLADEDGNNTGYSLLGTDGTRYGVDYDYTLAGLNLSALPGHTPATAINQVPTASGLKDVQADTNGLSKSMIHINYGNDMTDIPTLASGKWVYNKEDGWFYYTEALASGVTTPNLLNKLVFDAAMGKEYNSATYDLTVKLEVIQATKEALTDSAGWNLGGGSTPTGDTLAIVNKLAP